MKLLRYGTPGNEKPGLELENGHRIDCSTWVSDYDPDFFMNNGIEELKRKVSENAEQKEIPQDSRLGPPITNVGKIICIGLNYIDHAREAGMEPPAEPILFFKATTSIVGPNDDIMIPRNSKKVDWEVELAIVIGKKASYVEKSEAYDHVAGYMLMNDVSEREFQLERGGQWVKGKSADTFSPIGPYMVTKEDIPDPNNLNLWLRVNDKVKQQSNTNKFIFKVHEVVSYISQFMTLMPGDIISTGTPPGVGMANNEYLNPGDVVTLGVDGLGESSQHVVPFSMS